MRGTTLARLLVVLAGLAVVLATGATGAAFAAPPSPVRDGATQPVFSYADAIREHVMVQTSLDSTGTGTRDMVAADIIRPKESSRGLKVPVIMDASPYYDNLCRGNDGQCKAYDAGGLETLFPLFYDNYFVPRGYAVVLVDMDGTNRSTGCPTTGGAADILGVKAVIDWLNGRARAFNQDGSPAVASWTTGKVGLIGKSYDGTLANGVAATGVRGLATIVPISGISSWYQYYRMNGVVYFKGGPAGLADVVSTGARKANCAGVRQQLQAGSDDATGDYNAFWNERNYRTGTVGNVDNVHASVFVVHGLNDLNVKPDHFATWWAGLAREGVPRKIWLSQDGHVDPFDFRRATWIPTLHAWFDRWLYGIQNGIMRQPRVDLEVAPDQWVTQRDWPSPEADTTRLFLNPGPSGQPGLLSGERTHAVASAGFTDSPLQSEATMVANPGSASANRLLFLSAPLAAPLRISGTVGVDVAVSSSQAFGNLSALLVDYGDDTRVDYLGAGEGITTSQTQKACYGEGDANDDGCFRLTQTATVESPVNVVARGLMDMTNRFSLRTSVPLTPGTTSQIAWHLLPQDYTFKAGHRLAVVIASSDADLADPDQPSSPTFTVDLRRSSVTLPVVGGEDAISFSSAPTALPQVTPAQAARGALTERRQLIPS